MFRADEHDIARIWQACRCPIPVGNVARTNDELTTTAESMDAAAESDLVMMGKVYRFPTHFFLTHAVAHGVEHRTEIRVALAQLAVTTSDLDGWHYATHAGYGRQA